MTDKEIGKRFKFFRESLDKKQGEFANELNVNQQSISDIERGIKNISLEIIEILLVKFKLDSNWLITGQGRMKQESSQSGIASNIAAEENVEYGIGYKQGVKVAECSNCQSLEKQLLDNIKELMEAQRKIIRLQEELLQRPTPVVPVVSVPIPIQRST